VVEVTPDRKSPFMKIRVKPAAHLDRLEEVMVLMTREDLKLKNEPGAGPETAPAAANAKAATAPAKAQ